jgi:hypothetical protein
VSEHLVAQLGNPGFHRVEPPTELAKLIAGLAKPPVDLGERPVHLGESAGEEVYALLVLTGPHGSSLPQADRSFTDRPFKCVWAWTPEDLPRPTPLR